MATTLINKLKNLATKINSNSQNNADIPNLLGRTLNNRFNVTEKLNTYSSESDLYKAIDINDNSEQIVKLYRRKDALKAEVIAKIFNSKPQYVAPVSYYSEELGFTYVVMPYFTNGSLRSYLQNCGTFSEQELKEQIIPQIVTGLNNIHQLDILHKDLKPDNVMIDNEGNLVIIDFGISSVTNGNTVVFTQTGMTPTYLAPEAFNNSFTKETDYYALGIMIYELFTGFTPFQNSNISSSQLAGLASIQKIPFAVDFPQDLKNLILGLTYKDISNRNEANNPNKRWTYTEVQKWLKGEEQVIPGDFNSSLASASSNSKQTSIPYKFNGTIYTSNYDLIDALGTNWELGKKEVGRGLLERHYDINNKEKETEFCRQAMEVLQNNPNDDFRYQKLLYQLEPTLTKIYWQGYVFTDLNDYGNALINEAKLGSKGQDKIVKSAKKLLNAFLINYCKNKVLDKDLSQNYVEVLELQKKLLTEQNIDDTYQALRLGYALTGREDFVINKKSYSSIQDFLNFCNELYDKDVVAYVSFINKIKDDLAKLKNIFVGKKSEQLDSVIKTTLVFDKGNYCFRSYQEFYQYVAKLYNSNRLEELYEFKQKCFNDIKSLNPQDNKDKEYLNEYKHIVNNLIIVDEYVFKDKNSLNEYTQNLKQKSLFLYKRFNEVHEDSLEALNVLQANDFRNSINKNIKINDVVKFGQYWQESLEKKSPIMWRVLDVKDGKALLLSDIILDVKPFKGHTNSNKWSDSSIRKWLNSSFLENSFSKMEQKQIVESKIVTRDDNDSNDKIWLLDDTEAQKYLKDKRAKFSNYAAELDLYTDNGYGYYWLRSPGSFNNSVYVVGRIYNNYVNFTYVGVRPALWINL